MAKGTYIGLPKADLLDIYNAALAQVKAGTIITNYSDSGTSVGKSVVGDANERMAEAYFALSQLEPESYPERVTVIRTDWSNLQD
jgi:hypothetical protein